MPTTEIVMKPNGFYRRKVSEEFIGDMSSHLREAAQSVPSTISMVGKISPDYPFHTHLQFKSTHIFAYTRLTELKLNTTWRFTGEALDRVYPCFYRQEANDFMADYTWPLPANMALWFICMWNAPGKPGMNDPVTLREWSPLQQLTARHLAKVYLIAIKGKAAGFLRLPLCNLYEDAAVCMGNTLPSEIQSGPILDRMKAAVEHFRSSSWNHDLRQHQNPEDGRAIFMLSPKGKPLKDGTPENWERHCRKVNNTNYSDLQLPDLTNLGL